MKMTMIYVRLMILLFLFCTTIASAQTDNVDVPDSLTEESDDDFRNRPSAPPESLYKQVMVSTPEMASLAKNVSCPVNYSTGVPQISIPLFTIRSGDNGSGDGSLTHFFIDALDDSITYSCESGELANAKTTPERRLKDRIALFPLECLNGTDIRIRA